MRERMTDDLVVNALNRLCRGDNPPRARSLTRTRAGSTRARECRRRWPSCGIECSMGTRGDCFDNASAENFIATLKREEIHHGLYPSRQGARRRLFQHVEVFYNRQPLHSALGYVNPVEFLRC